MPGKNRLGAHEKRSPAHLGQNSARRSQKRPILWREIRARHLASEHLELMAEHDDLDLLCVLGAKPQDDELNQAAKGPVQEGHNHEVARLHRRRRLRHAFEPPVPHRERATSRIDSSFRHPHPGERILEVDPGAALYVRRTL